MQNNNILQNPHLEIVQPTLNLICFTSDTCGKINSLEFWDVVMGIVLMYPNI